MINKVKIWRDRKGKWITINEFLQRFLQGVEGITAMQQVKTQMWSMIPVFGGIIWGIVFTYLSKTYWMTLILIGTLPITIIQFVGMFQKYRNFKKIEKLRKEALLNAR